jgi:4-hydroxy-tetrahydrodipicolinate synthase
MFQGVYTAIVTPFLDDGRIDEEALRRLVDFQITEGVQGLVPMGTTGESPTVNHNEHIAIIRIVIDQTSGRVPVIAGTGSNSTLEAIELTRQAKMLGATATLQVTPYYNKPTQDGLYWHFHEIAEECDLPIIIYNIPGRSGVNLETDTLLRLTEHKNIVAVKEASGNLSQMMDIIANKPKDFNVLSGDDNLTFPLICLGGKGVISVASNLIPAKITEFVKLALDGEYDKARKMHYELNPLFKILFLETNPIPVKAAMAYKGMLNEVYRLPMCHMREENKQKLIKLLKLMEI